MVGVTPTANGQTGTAATAMATVVAPSTPTATVLLNKSAPTLSDTLTATATTKNADGHPVTLTYVWKDLTHLTAGPNGDGILQTTSNTSTTTDTLNLQTATGVGVETGSR